LLIAFRKECRLAPPERVRIAKLACGYQKSSSPRSHAQ
jgi:hypothetical protein